MKYYSNSRKVPIAMKTLREELIEVFPNMTEASKKTGIPISSISAVCNGINNQAGGYKWEKVIESKN